MSWALEQFTNAIWFEAAYQVMRRELHWWSLPLSRGDFMQAWLRAQAS